MKTLIVAGTLASLASLFAMAPAARAEGSPQPGQEMTDLKPFAGTWTCTTKGKDGKNVGAKVSFRAPTDLGGFWYEAVFARDKTADSPAFVGHGFLGFDSVNSKYYFTGADNMGGWVVLVGALSNKVLDLAGNANLGGHQSPFKFKLDASGKANTLQFSIGANLEIVNDCKK